MKKFSVWSILALLTVLVATSSVFAVRSQKELDELNRRKIDPRIYKGTQYAFPDETSFSMSRGRDVQSSASSSFQSASPGKVVGTTYYDYQANGTMGRQVQTGKNGTIPNDTLIVHFAWMKADDVAAGLGNGRGYGWRAWNAKTGGFTTGAPVHIQDPPGDFRAGYTVQDVTAGNISVVGGHQVITSASTTQVFWDFSPGAGFFTTKVSNLPLAVGVVGTPGKDQYIWPKMAYQVVSGTPVTHVVAAYSDPAAGNPQPLKYFRKVGTEEAGTWTLGRQIDTVFLLSYDVAASKTTEKMVICWTADRPNTGDCDTCSSNNGQQFVQLDNDAYCQISTNGGVTFQPRKNLTKNQDGVAGFRPYANMSAMITTANNAVVVWDGRDWPSDANSGGQAGLLRGRLFFWSEAFPANVIRTVHNAGWDQTDCNGGAFNLNTGKLNVAECNNKLYVVFAQFNDIPNGVSDDCAARATSDPGGSANGDLYIVVSSDGGVTWDQARDITNSRTPGCDSATGTGGPCYADQYPTLAPFGTNYVGNFGDAPLIVPSGGSADGNWLDLQYIQDADPGGVIQNEGTWQNNNVAWARIACVAPVPNPVLSLQYSKIAFPAFGNPGVEKDSALIIENTGNVNLTYTVAKFETTGPAGWLGFTGFTSPVASGFFNTVTGTIRLNVGGISSPAGKAVLKGGLVFTSNAPTSPDTLPILFTVADTVAPPSLDTLFVRKAGVAKLALTVSSNGNFGNQGQGAVNLDYDIYGDCDTANSDVYLYDGSAVIGWISGADTLMNWTIFGDNWLNDTSALRPYFGLPDSAKWHPRFRDCPNFEYYRSARFVTHDTVLAMEKTWWAPKLPAAGSPDDSLFIIQGLKVWNISGSNRTGVMVGEVIDWDIPSDSGAVNSSGIKTTNPITYIYQRGVDFNDSAGNAPCQADSLRFGGVSYLYRYTKNGASPVKVTGADTLPYSAYTAENDSFVFPNNGLLAGELYRNMSVPGLAVSDSIEDLHMAMCFKQGLTINSADTQFFYSSYASVRTGTRTNLENRFIAAKSWFNSKGIATIPRDSCASSGCCIVPIRGDVNLSNSLNVIDLNYLVAYFFSGGPAPLCATEADVNASNNLNVIDLNYLVAYFFSGGPAPAACP